MRPKMRTLRAFQIGIAILVIVWSVHLIYSTFVERNDSASKSTNAIETNNIQRARSLGQRVELPIPVDEDSPITTTATPTTTTITETPTTTTTIPPTTTNLPLDTVDTTSTTRPFVTEPVDTATSDHDQTTDSPQIEPLIPISTSTLIPLSTSTLIPFTDSPPESETTAETTSTISTSTTSSSITTTIVSLAPESTTSNGNEEAEATTTTATAEDGISETSSSSSGTDSSLATSTTTMAPSSSDETIAPTNEPIEPEQASSSSEKSLESPEPEPESEIGTSSPAEATTEITGTESTTSSTSVDEDGEDRDNQLPPSSEQPAINEFTTTTISSEEIPTETEATATTTIGTETEIPETTTTTITNDQDSGTTITAPTELPITSDGIDQSSQSPTTESNNNSDSAVTSQIETGTPTEDSQHNGDSGTETTTPFLVPENPDIDIATTPTTTTTSAETSTEQNPETITQLPVPEIPPMESSSARPIDRGSSTVRSSWIPRYNITPLPPLWFYRYPSTRTYDPNQFDVQQRSDDQYPSTQIDLPPDILSSSSSSSSQTSEIEPLRAWSQIGRLRHDFSAQNAKRESLERTLIRTLFQFTDTIANEIVSLSRWIDSDTGRAAVARFQRYTAERYSEIERLNRVLQLSNDYLQKLIRHREYDMLQKTATAAKIPINQ